MGQSILTAKQNKFLGFAQADEEINRWFYLTGGTALSEFYLKHRLSEDIDLFSTSQVNDFYIDSFFSKVKSRLQIKDIKKDHIMGLFAYKLFYRDGEELKVDFNEYGFHPIERSLLRFGNLTVDSFYDIGINKLYTTLGRFQTRDFIDLYFILQKGEFSLEQLIERTQDKFNTKIDPFYLASQFLRATDLPRAYPKMLVPFRFEQMIKYFQKQSKRLGGKLLR